MKSLYKVLQESSVKFRNIDDIKKYLDKFKDDETRWSGATDEIADMAKWSREFLDEFDNITSEPIDRKLLKTPSDWNSNHKKHILTNIGKMSKGTFNQYLAHLNNYF
jgi:hypothetical protein